MLGIRASGNLPSLADDMNPDVVIITESISLVGCPSLSRLYLKKKFQVCNTYAIIRVIKILSIQLFQKMKNK